MDGFSGCYTERTCKPGATTAMFSARDSLLSTTTLRFLALGNEITVVSPSEIEKSETGEFRILVYLGALKIRRAAAFWISCSGLMADAGRPASRELQ